MIEARVAQRGKGLLREFNEAGVLDAADVHVALRLAALGGETRESVHLATALVVRAVRSGSVCLDLSDIRNVVPEETGDGHPIDPATLPWPDDAVVADALRSSPLVIGGDAGPLRPLRLVDHPDGDLLYLDRYHRQEETVRRILDARAGSDLAVDENVLRTGLAALFRDRDDTSRPSAAPDRQRVAAAVAATHRTSVIAGGPGTGKTHTVARVLALLERLDPGLRIGLAAPTGKAAARLAEEVLGQAQTIGLRQDLSASTLHRMLGTRPGTSRCRYNATNHLPYDVVVVDETSMVPLTMMCRLLEAVRPDARLVLVGDPDQLTSVDAGAVLADLVARPVPGAVHPALARVVGEDLAAPDTPDEPAVSADDRNLLVKGMVRLSRSRRFGGGIGDLAAAVREGRAQDALAILLSADYPDVEWGAADDPAAVRADVLSTAAAMTAAACAGNAAAALTASEEHRVLCANREGPRGASWWARDAMTWIGEATGTRLDPHRRYPGQPLLVTANDYDTGIFNGDTAVVVADGAGGLVAAFDRGAGHEPELVHPSRLSSVQTVYAMTIHRSQGSQYGRVSVILPEAGSRLLTRELLYTAITRARTHVRIVGDPAVFAAAVGRQVQRASGLRRG
ncbi:exodeoxyribonuclease V subunit alpha [Prescottella subtropica]|uniref:exodeoxyribonuclease V subunit alpha n=1 Tax=Prescottella subtropica TaxID=2545757 RepID=UPI0010F61743|nr:exodeoxyribonuclease V subunit alpha [Prescottella subtropica]